MKALRVLYRFAFNSHKLVVLRDHLRRQTRENIIGRTFVRWIEAYSERMKLRARQEWLVNRSSDRRMAQIFGGWRRQAQACRQYRDNVRAVVPMRCLLRMIAQRENVPAAVLDRNQEIAQELYICTQFYDMNFVDEQSIYDSIVQFQRNLLAAVFKALKPAHLKHPMRAALEKKTRIHNLERSWSSILRYAQEQRVLRLKFKHVSGLHQAKMKRLLLHTWLQRLSEKNTMLQRTLKAGQHFRPICTRRYFEHFKAYARYRRAKYEKSNVHRLAH